MGLGLTLIAGPGDGRARDTQNPKLPVPWRVGEHVAVIGDTGTGKTFLISKLVRLRNYVVFFQTKSDDIRFPGFVKRRTADALESVYDERIILHPDYERQAREGWRMLEKVWQHGGWTVVIDELWYVDKLGLRDWVDRLLTQGRSKRISVVVGMQRPAQISRFAMSQCTHLFSFRVEGRDAKTIAESSTPKLIPYIMEPRDENAAPDPRLVQGHDFAYYHRGLRIVSTGNAKKLYRVIRFPTNAIDRATA